MGREGNVLANNHASRGSRSKSTGKGERSASTSTSKASIHEETLRMIQELGIPGAATEPQGSSPDLAAGGKKKKKGKEEKRSPLEEAAGKGARDHGIRGAPKRSKGETGETSVPTSTAPPPPQGGHTMAGGKRVNRGEGGRGATTERRRGSADGGENTAIKTADKGVGNKGRDQMAGNRSRASNRGRGRGGSQSGGRGWSRGEDAADLGSFAAIKLKHPVAESEGNWYDDVPASVKGVEAQAKRRGDKKVSQNDSATTVTTPKMVAQARAAGKALLEAEVNAWTARRAKHATSDDRWVEQVLRSGTLSDKVAALTLQVQESPIHRLGVLEGLLDLGLKKERRTAQMALEALKDLFITNLLPSGRRLVPFESRPLFQVFNAVEKASSSGGGGEGVKATAAVGTALLMWFFEDQIRAKYFRMVGAIEAGSRDTVENFKRFSLEAAKDILEAKPEGEDRLLALLTNKLGDPERKISAKAIHLLQTILRTHPAMKGVVIREVQQYLHRPGLQHKALYAGIIFLNQVNLTRKDDAALASSLVQTYLKLFEAATSSSPSPSAVSKSRKKGGKNNASVVETAATGTRLLSALLTGVNRARPYLPPGDPGVGGTIGSLFRVVHTGGFASATQALSLLFQVMPATPDPPERRRLKFARPEAASQAFARERGGGSPGEESGEKIRARFYSALYTKLLSPDLGGASNPVLFLNLVYKAIKADDHGPRVNAFAKRVLQVCSVCEAPLAAAGVFVVSEALKKHPDLRSALFDRATEISREGNDSAEGVVGDVERERRKSFGDRTGDEGLRIPGYDRSKRDPRFSFSGSVVHPLWEASLLRSHVHPSVSKFAEGLVSRPKHAVEYRGDPLADFALMPFLDRMAYRNPKARDPTKHVGVMHRTKPAGVARTEAPVNAESFVAQPREAISADKVFFHKFFREKAERDRARGVVSDKNSQKKNASQGDDLDEEFMVDQSADDQGGLGFDVEGDSEEEAFAMKLAEGLMKDSGADHDDYEDEDPDMEGWSDLDGSDDDDGGNGDAGVGGSKPKRSSAGGFPGSRGVVGGGDADDVMEEDSDSDPEDLEEEDSEAEEVQDTAALRRITDGMADGGDGGEDDDESDNEEDEGEEKYTTSKKRRVSWLKRGKMAPSYEDDDEEEEEDDDEEENEGSEDEEEESEEDYDDERTRTALALDGGVEDDDGNGNGERGRTIGGGKTAPAAAVSKKTRFESDEIDDEHDSDTALSGVSSSAREKGHRGEGGESTFASFEDYEQILDAWDPDNPDAPLPGGISALNRNASSASKRGAGGLGRGRGSGRGKGRRAGGDPAVGSGSKRHRHH